MDYTTLRNGVKVPFVGLGTYPMRGDVVKNAVRSAINCGYELFDSAWYYRNEKEIGEIVRTVPRDKVFICSKLKAEQWLGRRRWLHLDKKSALRCYKDTLKRYKLDYLDLYLLHSYIDFYMESWAEMVELYESGLVKAIGVCSCTIEQLKRFYAMYGHYPMINQVELHPFFQRNDLLEFCKDNGIQLMAFSPFAHGDHMKEILQNEMLKNISAKYNKTIGQIILRWFVQRGIVVIPQSSNPKHIQENINVFDFCLTDEEMEHMASIDQNQSYGSFSVRRQKYFLGIPLNKH